MLPLGSLARDFRPYVRQVATSMLSESKYFVRLEQAMAMRRELETLDRERCLDLLRTVRVGRLVFTEGALPAVQPVNFRLYQDNIVIRVAGGAKLRAATGNAVVAFQADELDPDLREGWSVTVVGHANLILDTDTLVEMSGIWLQPWASGRRDHFIRIQAEKVTGRRLYTVDTVRPHAACP